MQVHMTPIKEIFENFSVLFATETGGPRNSMGGSSIELGFKLSYKELAPYEWQRPEDFILFYKINQSGFTR